MENSYQHPPIIITIQSPSAWEGVLSPGPPEQTPIGRSALPTGRTRARASLHPRQQQREQPPRARTHFQATSKTLTTLGRSHVRSHPAKLWGSHTPSLSCAQHYWLLQTLHHGGTRTTPRKGNLGERVTGVLETRKRQPLTPPQP